MKFTRNFGLFFAIISTTCLTAPANAQSLLGIIGGGDSGALITLESGEAGDSGW